ncbi:uncharacterized protein LOC119459469 [Dermacentor silvarum]|uniref:uncharacterized protein LOC119459469 n=1 Tax=Dermacentor silvarum TaxID=543639 RepID=UPI00189A94E4|nr:uncharacterized protein LOC119459469 [Dermacentor silvarum]
MRVLLCILVTYILVCITPTEGEQGNKRMCSRIRKQSNCLGDKVAWQYDKDKGKCKPFLTGVCSRRKGFPTCRSCMKTCQKKLSKVHNGKGPTPSKDDKFVGICPPYE